MAASDHSDPLHRRRRHLCEPILPPLCPSNSLLVTSLITLSREIIDSQTCILSQRRNCLFLYHRIKILLLLLAEVRDSTASISLPSVVLCFTKLHSLLQEVKLLTENCAQSSRIRLLFEHLHLSEFFRRISQKMASALEILPLPLLDVSCDMREQVELVQQQAKKAKLYVDTKEARLCAEVKYVMRQIERRETPEVAKLREIFDDLELRHVQDCERELERLETEDIGEACDVVPAGKVKEAEPLRDLIAFVRYCKCVLYGATVNDTILPATTEEPEIVIPDEFRCPISLDLMREPVIVATGHTYERTEITRWIDGNNRTCPMSGLTLAHTTLIPNYALRNLIRQWCARHNTQHCTPVASLIHANCSASLSTPIALEATKLTVEFLIRQLPSANPDTQRHIVGEIGVLAKCSCDYCKVIADAGAIPSLIPLLSAADVRMKEHAVTTMLNLSIYVPNKARLIDAGALDHLIRLLKEMGESGEAARENAVVLLFSLSQSKEAAMEMGRKPDAMEGLLQMLKFGNAWGKRVAASALFNMAVMCAENREAMVEARMVEDIISMLLSTGRAGLQEEGIALLEVLMNSRKGRGAAAVSAMELMPVLVEMLGEGRPKSKENAAAILLCLYRYGSHSVRAKVQVTLYSIVPLLHDLLYHGTPRTRRKAGSLLRTLLY